MHIGIHVSGINAKATYGRKTVGLCYIKRSSVETRKSRPLIKEVDIPGMQCGVNGVIEVSPGQWHGGNPIPFPVHGGGLVKEREA